MFSSSSSDFSKSSAPNNLSNHISYMNKFYQFNLIGRTKLPSTDWNKNNSKEDYQLQTIRGNISYPNKGIICGKWNDIFVLDIDMNIKPNKKKGIKARLLEHKEHPFFMRFGLDILDKLNTYTTATANNGFHIYFKYDKSIPRNTANAKLMTDIRSEGGYVVAPFSYLGDNPYEKQYTLHNEADIIECPVDIREWIINEVIAKTNKPNPNTKKPKLIKSPSEEHIEEVISYGSDLTKYSYTFSEKELRSVLDGLPDEYFEEYEKWLIFTTAMKQLHETDSFDEVDTHELWDEYSKKHSPDNYDKVKNDNNWDGISEYKTLKCLWSLFNKSEYNGSENILQYTMMKEVNTNLTTPDSKIYSEKLGYEFFDMFHDDDISTIHYKEGKPYTNPALQYKNVVVKSDTGTGKTTSFYHYVKRHHQKNHDKGYGFSFISLTSRISLAEEQYKVFNLNGLECLFYKNVEAKNIEECDSVVCQIDSIMKLSRGLYFGYYYDFIIYLDEFNSIVEYLITSPTLENKRIEVFYALKELLTTAKQVIMTDADISDTSLKLLKIFDIEYSYIQNTYSHNKGVPAEEIFSRFHFLNKIKMEEKFICCCDSKTEAEIIFNELNDEKVQLITAETTKLPNFDDHDRIIYSPKVIYGIDSVMERPVYCFYKEHTISPNAMVQQIARCRNITKLTFHFKDKRVRDYDFDNLKQCRDFLIMKDEYIIKNSWCMGDKIDDYIDLLINFKYSKDAHNTNKFAHFIKIITERGFIFNKQYKKNLPDIMGKKLMKRNMEIKLERFDPESPFVKKTNEILKIPPKYMDDYKSIFVDPYKITTHLNVKDFFLNFCCDENSGYENENIFKYELELKRMNDWNMNKATTRRSHLMYVHELLKELSSVGYSPSQFETESFTLLSPVKKEYFKDLYDVIHVDRIDNPFSVKDISLLDYTNILRNEYQNLFGKAIIETKRRNIKQYNEDGSVKRKENGKLDYGKESYYVLNHNYLEYHDKLYDYSRKIKDRRYPHIHEEVLISKKQYQEFMFIDNSDDEDNCYTPEELLQLKIGNDLLDAVNK